MSDIKKLPKAGCKTLNDEQLAEMLDYCHNHQFNSAVETAYVRGFFAGICFLGVDEGEDKYNYPFDQFVEETYKEFYG